LFINLYLLLN